VGTGSPHTAHTTPTTGTQVNGPGDESAVNAEPDGDVAVGGAGTGGAEPKGARPEGGGSAESGPRD
jgi:hypothetical protein